MSYSTSKQRKYPAATAEARQERQSRQVAETSQPDEHYGVLPDLLAAL